MRQNIASKHHGNNDKILVFEKEHVRKMAVFRLKTAFGIHTITV